MNTEDTSRVLGSARGRWAQLTETFPRKGFARASLIVGVIATSTSPRAGSDWIAAAGFGTILSLMVAGGGAVIWMLLSIDRATLFIRKLPPFVVAIVCAASGMVFVMDFSDRFVLGNVLSPLGDWFLLLGVPVFVARWQRVRNPSTENG